MRQKYSRRTRYLRMKPMSRKCPTTWLRFGFACCLFWLVWQAWWWAVTRWCRRYGYNLCWQLSYSLAWRQRFTKVPGRVSKAVLPIWTCWWCLAHWQFGRIRPIVGWAICKPQPKWDMMEWRIVCPMCILKPAWWWLPLSKWAST